MTHLDVCQEFLSQPALFPVNYEIKEGIGLLHLSLEKQIWETT